MKKILFIPIDNRPATYSLTSLIADVNKSLNLVMPERELLGGLTSSADINGIFDWLEKQENADLIVISLDTIGYGGLVPSRRSNDTYDEINERVLHLKNVLKNFRKINPDIKIYAFSSVMRISNNNINEEEKEYWNKWGKRIYEYSYFQHKSRVLKEANCVLHTVPSDILEDYLDTRKRNFEINKGYLNWLNEGILDFLAYSKDDSGEYGLNVEEASILEKGINSNGLVKTGADEIPLSLLARGLAENIKVKVEYNYPDSVSLISKYEDVSVRKSVEGQIELQNLSIVNEGEDFTLFVNNFKTTQGDLVFRDVINKNSPKLPSGTLYTVADINNANGADEGMINAVLRNGYNENFLGYSGYNTSANSIGSALLMGVVSYLAKKEDNFNETCFKKLIITRFLDDWAYQANIRSSHDDFKPYEEIIKNFVNEDFYVKYSSPWNRSFEIEAEVKI